jgi:hypothetical protein
MAADVASVFLNTDEHATAVWFYPKGDRNSATSVTVIPSEGSLEGTREAKGDGVVFDRADGYANRESVILDMAASVAIEDPPNPKRPDMFLIGGEIFCVKRVMGRDDDMQTVLVVRRTDQLDRRQTRTG